MLVKAGVAVGNCINVESKIRDEDAINTCRERGDFAGWQDAEGTWAGSPAIANPTMTLRIDRHIEVCAARRRDMQPARRHALLKNCGIACGKLFRRDAQRIRKKTSASADCT